TGYRSRLAALRRGVLRRDRTGSLLSVAHVTRDESIASERARKHARSRLGDRIARKVSRSDPLRLPLRSGSGTRRVFRGRVADRGGVPHRSLDETTRASGDEMAILKVARLGHPVLRNNAADVEIADIKSGKFNSLIEDMIETMHAYEGVGLAGPQIHLPLRILFSAVGQGGGRR